MFDLVLKIEADGMMSGHQSNQSFGKKAAKVSIFVSSKINSWLSF